MRVLVCGGRFFGEKPDIGASEYAVRQAAAQRQFIDATLDRLCAERGFTVLIHGGARGVDTLAAWWALRHPDIEVLPFKANWRPDGPAGPIDRSAGPKRNQRMLDEGVPDLVVAFPGNRGTADMVRRAEAAGVEVIRMTQPG